MDSAATGEKAWPELHRVRRAIVVVDVVESVRLMQAHEADFIDRWRRFVNEVRTQVLPAQRGRMVKSLGDGMLLEFGNVPDAVAATMDLQRRVRHHNQGKPADALLSLRAGINVADVVVDELDIYGQGVNLAARLAASCDPGTTVVSVDAREQLAEGIDVELVDRGETFLKNLDEPVRSYWVQRIDAEAEVTSLSPVPSLRPSVAFLSLTADEGQGALASLVADELAAHASVVRTVDVISRLSTRRAPSAMANPLAMLRKLHARYGVSGSCTVLGPAARLTIELVYVETNQTVWSDAFKASVETIVMSPANVFGPVCQTLLEQIEVHEARRALTLPIQSLHSYSLLVGGVSLMHRLGRRDFERARELLDAVIERVPRHPDAYAWLAKWHILRAHQGWSDDPPRSHALARDVAQRALERDPSCSLAMTIGGMVKVYFERDLDAGAALYRQAIDANPNDALAWLLKGTLHGFRGEGEAAVEDTRRAMRLSPLDPMRYYFDSLAASAAASAGLYDEAIELATRSLRANSMHASTLRVLAISYGMKDDVESARPVVERLLALEPSFTVSRFLERAPGAAFDVGRRFADALARAGVPR